MSSTTEVPPHDVVPNADLKPGDRIVVWYSTPCTVVRIDPYRGPHAFISGICVCDPPMWSHSLERGRYSKRIRESK
jgi:hypothetical protein